MSNGADSVSKVEWLSEFRQDTLLLRCSLVCPCRLQMLLFHIGWSAGCCVQSPGLPQYVTPVSHIKPIRGLLPLMLI